LGKEQELLKLDYDAESIARGLMDFQKGKKPERDVNESELLLQILSDVFEQKAAENQSRAEQFFRTLATKAALTKVIDNQLYYEVLVKGTGQKMIEATSKPLIHYTVSAFEDIKIVDTYKNGEPVQMPLCDAIPGFVKGIIGMREGERRRLYVHPDLAYTRGGFVPPNSVLIFDVAVIEISE
jgi:peptidylprolyl isomerase